MKKSSKKILIVGAGNIGSRHLQALKAVSVPLEIFVVDSSEASLLLAKERYESMPVGKCVHEINFLQNIPDKFISLDLAIIATCADIRADIVKKLLKITKIKYLILEKLLFCNKSDYNSISKLLKITKTKTWVNCSMRMMSIYRDGRADFLGRKLFYSANWSGYGLVTSAIHYIDHMVFLNGSDDFVVLTDGLDKNVVASKRKGFVDFTGALSVLFKNGSIGTFVCNKNGKAPITVSFFSDKARFIVKETESRAWHADELGDWQWSEIEAKIPFQSQLSTQLVESILNSGKCELVDYEQSKKTHLQFLEPVFKFLNKNSKKKYNYYPFT